MLYILNGLLIYIGKRGSGGGTEGWGGEEGLCQRGRKREKRDIEREERDEKRRGGLGNKVEVDRER